MRTSFLPEGNREVRYPLSVLNTVAAVAIPERVDFIFV
jgi:hypothetical protein